ANPATRPSNTTNAATNGATGSRSCSGVSKTGGVSRRAMTGAQWPSSPQSLSLLPLSSGSDQRVLSLEQGLLVRKVLVHSADRNPCTLCYTRGGQPVRAFGNQNLNSRFENCIDRRGRAGLTRLFAGF